MRRYVVLLIALAACAAPVSASAAMRFHRIAGFPSPGHAREVQQGRHPQGRPEEGAERARAEPGHLGERRLLRAARKGRRRAGPRAGRCGRSSGARTCSRTTRVLNRAKRAARRPRRQLFDYYLGWLTDRAITDHFQFIPDADVRVRAQWGMRVGDRGPAAGRRGARKRRGGKVVRRRPLARRLDHHRVRDLGLRRAGPAREGCRGSSSSTAAAARRRSPPRRRTERA